MAIVPSEEHEVREAYRPRTKPPVITATYIVVAIIAVVVAFIAGTRSTACWRACRAKTSTDSLDFSQVQDLYRTLAANYDGSRQAKTY